MIIDYFKQIDTKAKAYWLGYLYADGYINKKNHTILQCKLEDRFLIDEFAKAINHHNIYYIENRSDHQRTRNESIRLSVHNTTFTSYLNYHGCVNRKSRIIRFPKLDNFNLDLAFLLGYFDGDGCVPDGCIVSGSYEFLVDVKSTFYIPNPVKPNNVIYSLQLPAETRALMYLNYENSLPRKRNTINTEYYRCNEFGIIGRIFKSPYDKKGTTIKPRVTKEELTDLIWKAPAMDVGKYLGISNVMVHNYCKKYNIPTPPQGYWLNHTKEILCDCK